MKKKTLFLAALLSLGLTSAWAGGNENSGVRYVKAPRFARPLVEKWIKEYEKTQPEVSFQIVKGNQHPDAIDITVVSSDQDIKPKDFSQVVYFGETAVLPITARSSEAARVLDGKRLNSKKLKQLFFLNDDFDEDVKKIKQFEKLVIYSGSNHTSVGSAFAHNFGEESSSFRGKRISGDDLFLNTALSRDPLGVSFNALSNIYDLQSRHVKEDLSLVGLDLKKDLAAIISNTGSLDDLLTALESGKPSEVPIERVGVTYNTTDDAVTHFLQWVLEKGTQYNHEYGLLNLDRKDAQEQQEQVRTILTAQK